MKTGQILHEHETNQYNIQTYDVTIDQIYLVYNSPVKLTKFCSKHKNKSLYHEDE